MNILNMLDCLHDCCNSGLEFVLQHAINIIKSNLHMKKVIEVFAFNLMQLVHGQMFQLCFF